MFRFRLFAVVASTMLAMLWGMDASPAVAFEFQPFDPGTEQAVIAPSARVAGKPLPYLQAGNVNGRVSVRGWYDVDGQRVFFETRRGAVAQDHTVAADLPYENDICIRDADGLPLYASFAGDEALIADCEPSNFGKMINANPELLSGTTRSFGAARRTLTAIKTMAFLPEFRQEKSELLGPRKILKRMQRNNILNHRGSIITGGEDLPPLSDFVRGTSVPEDTNAQASYSVWYRHFIEMFKAPALYITAFDHSATVAWLGYSYDRQFTWLLFAWEARNHGRHYYQWPMYEYCIFASGFDPPLVGGTRTAIVPHGRCRTCYGWYSQFGCHNCNDDAMLQYYDVKYNYYWDEWRGLPCNDSWINLYAPKCR